MTQIQGKLVLLRVSGEFQLPRVRVIGVQLYFPPKHTPHTYIQAQYLFILTVWTFGVTAEKLERMKSSRIAQHTSSQTALSYFEMLLFSALMHFLSKQPQCALLTLFRQCKLNIYHRMTTKKIDYFFFSVSKSISHCIIETF